VTHRYHEYGGGAVPAFSWKAHGPAPCEVDTVAGMLLVLSPWAVRNVRFDEALALGHGYDVDYCMQARAKGRKVVTADISMEHYGSLGLVSDIDVWIEAHIDLSDKWEDEELTEEEWKRRARRAEAEREVARSIAYGSALASDARVLGLENAMRRTTHSLSWRLTEPLRRANHWRQQRLSENGRGP
jgi:hypothetical protein